MSDLIDHSTVSSQAASWREVHAVCIELGVMDYSHTRSREKVIGGIQKLAADRKAMSDLLKELITTVDIGASASPMILAIVNRARDLK